VDIEVRGWLLSIVSMIDQRSAVPPEVDPAHEFAFTDRSRGK
jgi:hypothetical protein